MIVLDANILIRAVLGRRVRQLVEIYSAQGFRFVAPDVAFNDARKYLPPLLKKRPPTGVQLRGCLRWALRMQKASG
jgi:PIN domain